jgi:hypothetical protein
VEQGKIVPAEFGYGGKILPSPPIWLIDGKKTVAAGVVPERMAAAADLLARNAQRPRMAGEASDLSDDAPCARRPGGLRLSGAENLMIPKFSVPRHRCAQDGTENARDEERAGRRTRGTKNARDEERAERRAAQGAPLRATTLDR